MPSGFIREVNSSLSYQERILSFLSPLSSLPLHPWSWDSCGWATGWGRWQVVKCDDLLPFVPLVTHVPNDSESSWAKVFKENTCYQPSNIHGALSQWWQCLLHNCVYLVYKAYSHTVSHFRHFLLTLGALSRNTEWKAGSLVRKIPGWASCLIEPSDSLCSLVPLEGEKCKHACQLHNQEEAVLPRHFFPGFSLHDTLYYLFTFQRISPKLFSSSPSKSEFRNPSIHELTLSVAQRCFSASSSVLTNPNPKFSQETEFRM